MIAILLHTLTVLCLFALLTQLAMAGALNCHLHAPDDYRPFGNRPLVIPSVGSRKACENLNRERFGGQGLCHCAADAFGMGSRRLPGVSADGPQDSMPLP